MGGTAIWRASETIVAKGRPIAADALEAAEADIAFDDGHFAVVGTNRSIALLDVAARAREAGTPLDTYHAWTREHMTFPNGTHVVEVEIDRDTGAVALVRHTAVDDYGVLVNPMIAAGQAHGAIAQGVGQALLEHAAYDAQSGQLLAGSFMDYAMPRADDLPSFDLEFNGTRCTTNPLGVKGCGEAGAVAMLPAIGNAILDALAPLGVAHFDGPATPFRDLAGDAASVRVTSAQPFTARMIAAQRSSTGRIVSAFSDGRLTDTRFTSRSLISLDQIDILRLPADRDVERRADRVRPRPPSGGSAGSARSAASAIPR